MASAPQMTAIAATDHIQRFLRQVARSGDLAMVVLLLVAMAVLILPLPTMLIDALIAFNIGASVLILIVAIYLPHPLAFSTLPAVILTATLFRLSTEVAVTRMILVQADAGEIVKAFGDFVVSGNMIVGLVTFLIITVVQFVVITKGSERVAEVAARFTLDAMPGKQMSIDSDLRSGDIDQREARRRRGQLEQESQLYGAMDGAMKFVKGDAIAGLIIVLVNLLGGIAIGCLQLGMGWREAGHTYSLLTVGDGLVSQIPALVISFAAGTIVTRVAEEGEKRNLGTQITDQVAGNPRSLMMAAGALALLSIVPGFPTIVFLALAAGAAGRALWLVRQDRAARSGENTDAASSVDEAEPLPETAPDDAALVLALSPSWREVAGAGRIAPTMRRACETLGHDLGLELPALWVRTDKALPPGGFRLDLESVPAASGILQTESLLLRDDPAKLEPLGIAATSAEPMPGYPEVHWVAADRGEALRAAGIDHVDAIGALSLATTGSVRTLAAHFMGIQEARRWLAKAEPQYRELVQEVQRLLPLQVIAESCRCLLDEAVPLRPVRLILGALAEAGAKEQSPTALADCVRIALKRQICHLHADAQGRIAALIVERDAEEAVRAAARQDAHALPLSAPDAALQGIIGTIRRHADRGSPPVVLVSGDIRRFLRELLARNDVAVPTLCYQELAAEFSVHPIASIGAAARADSATSLHVVENDRAAART